MQILILTEAGGFKNIPYYRIGIGYNIMKVSDNNLWLGFNYLDAIKKLEHRSIGLSIGLDL